MCVGVTRERRRRWEEDMQRRERRISRMKSRISPCKRKK